MKLDPLADIGEARQIGSDDAAETAAYLAEGHCPECGGRLDPAGPPCPACRHPLAICRTCGLGWWTEGSMLPRPLGGYGRWGSAKIDDPVPAVDTDALAAEIATATGLDPDVVSLVLSAETYVLVRLGIASPPI